MVFTMTTTTTTVIREAMLSDATKIQEIYMPYILETPYNLDTLIPTLDALQTRIHHASTKYPFLVAEHNQEVIGFIYASSFYEYGFKDACLLSIYVSNNTDVRGVGKLLYDHLEALLISNGMHYIVSSIVEDNTRSIKFHQKQHFIEFVRFPELVTKHNRFYTIVWMAKSLEPALEYIYLPSVVNEQELISR
ncbi:N-acetyltransferase family protein [Fundicoccus sp. Sow4_D5]|uniref:GNAT family N-acetyltransferase n=1 Tax=unclassified Fundicoccus TaxID=2761543 RepID=UPI003F93E0B2